MVSKYLSARYGHITTYDYDKQGKLIASKGFAFDAITYKIENNNVALYQKDDCIYSHTLWSADLPLTIEDENGIEHIAEDEQGISQYLGYLFDFDESILPQINELKDEVSDLTEDVNSLTEDVEVLDVKLEVLNTEVQTQFAVVGNQISNIEQDVTDLENDLNGKIVEVHDEIDELSTDLNDKITDAKVKIGSLEGKTDEIKDSISHLSSDVQNNANHIIEISAATAINADEIQENKDKIDDLYEKVDENSESIAQHGAEIADNRASIQAINTELETLLNTKGIEGVIDTFKDVEEFLKGITDASTLTEVVQKAVEASEEKINGEIINLSDDLNAQLDDVRAEVAEISDTTYTIDEIDTKFDEEKIAREAQDAVLQGKFDEEQEERREADTVLTSSIQAVSNEVATKASVTDLAKVEGKVELLEAEISDTPSIEDSQLMIESAIGNQKFKTINGISIKGEGNIVIQGGGEPIDTYTKEEIDEKLDEKASLASQEALGALVSTKADKSTTYTKTEADTAFAKKSDVPSISMADSSITFGYDTYRKKYDIKQNFVTSYSSMDGKEGMLTLSDISLDSANLKKAISNQQFKTINGESIKGSGNIVITGGTAYDDTEIRQEIASVSESVESIGAQLDDKASNSRVDDVENQLNDKASYSDLNSKAEQSVVDDLQNQIYDKASQSDLESLQSEVSEKASQYDVDYIRTDLTYKVNKEQVNNMFQYDASTNTLNIVTLD